MSWFTPNSQYATEQYADFILLTDAKQFLQIESNDTSRDWALQHAVSAACTGVSRFLNRPIGKTLYEPPYGVFNGGSGNTSSYIWLPKFPVLEVVSVIEYQGSTPVTLAEIDPNAADANYKTGDGYRVNYREGYIERILGGVWQRPWYPSEMGVLVSWWAGMNPVPADLWFDTMAWAAQLFRSTQQREAGNPFSRSGDNGADNSGAWPGMPKWLSGKLQTYVLPSVG